MKIWRRNFLILSGFLEALIYSGCLFGWPSLLLILQGEGIYGYLCENEKVGSLSVVMSDNATPFSTSAKLLTTYDSDTDYVRVTEKERPGTENLTSKILDSNHSNESQTLTTAGFLEQTNLTNGSTIVGCDEQRIQMTLIYTFAAVAFGITAVFIGFSLEYLGIRITRAVGSTFSCLGFLCLACISPDTSYLLWPALILIALGTNQLRLSGFLFADLWPEYRATILTGYSSAYAASTTFFLGVQMLYEWNVRMDLMCFISAGGCAITFIPTLFIPSNFLRDKSSVENNISTQNQEDEGDCVENNNFLNKSHEDIQSMKLDDVEQDSINAHAEVKQPFWKSILCVSGLLHIYWHFINLFLVLFFTSTFNIWISKVSIEPEDASFYIKMSGVCCLIALIFIPYTGVLTDRMIQRAEKISDPVKRLAYTMQAPTFAMAGATVLLALTMLCKIFVNEVAIYASLVLIALARPMVIGSCTSYIRLRFPSEHFSILNGVFTTIISILCFVQHPIMKLMTSSNDSFRHVQIFLLISLLLSLTSPGHMMIRKNIMRYARDRLYGSKKGSE